MRLKRFYTNGDTTTGNWLTECGRFLVLQPETIEDAALYSEYAERSHREILEVAERERHWEIAVSVWDDAGPEENLRRRFFLIQAGLAEAEFATRRDAVAALELALNQLDIHKLQIPADFY